MLCWLRLRKRNGRRIVQRGVPSGVKRFISEMKCGATIIPILNSNGIVCSEIIFLRGL